LGLSSWQWQQILTWFAIIGEVMTSEKYRYLGEKYSNFLAQEKSSRRETRCRENVVGESY